MTHRTALGTDPRGNLTRIDNALSQMPQRLESTKAKLDDLYQQQAAAREEMGKPFPYEDDLRVKSARSGGAGHAAESGRQEPVPAGIRSCQKYAAFGAGRTETPDAAP